MPQIELLSCGRTALPRLLLSFQNQYVAMPRLNGER